MVERSHSTPETYPTQAPSGRKERLGDILVSEPMCSNSNENFRRFALEETKKLYRNNVVFILMLESTAFK